MSPMMGAYSGVITDTQLSIAAFWAGHVGLIEGFEVEYDKTPTSPRTPTSMMTARRSGPR